MEGADITRIIVAGQLMDSLAHFVSRLVRKGDAEDISGQDAGLVHQKGKPPGKSTGFAGASSGNDTDESLSGRNRFPLRAV